MRLKKELDNSYKGDLKADGVHSFYLGRHIVRNGDRKQTFRKPPLPCSEFYHAHKPIFDKIGVNVDDSIVVSGCFKTNKSTLQRTMIPKEQNSFSGLPSIHTILKKSKAIKSVIRKLKIPQLPSCNINDLTSSKFNMETYPGFTYYEYLGHKNKLEALSDAMYIAKKRWNNITNCYKKSRKIKRNFLYPYTYSVGARNKREVNAENFDVLKSRPVHMPEFHGEICDCVWTDQIIDFIKTEKKGPIYIGNNYSQYSRIVNDLKDCSSIIEGDVKQFDSSLYINDIIIAVSLARLYYDINDPSIDNHFVSLFDSIGIKDYITPGGYVYRLIHGLPSGVKSTSLLGSIINLVNLSHCTRNVSQKKIKYVIGGDDFLIGLLDYKDQNFISEVESVGAEIGYEFKQLEYKNYSDPNFDLRPCFYKYTIDRNEPIVPTKVILERMLMPWAKQYNDNFSLLKFLNDLIPSLGAPRTHCFLFYKFYSYLYEQCTNKPLKIKDIYLIHCNAYNKVMKYGLPIKNDERGFGTLISSHYRSTSTVSGSCKRFFKMKYNLKKCLFVN